MEESELQAHKCRAQHARGFLLGQQSRRAVNPHAFLLGALQEACESGNYTAEQLKALSEGINEGKPSMIARSKPTNDTPGNQRT